MLACGPLETGLKIIFFQGTQLHLQNLRKGSVYRNQNTFGLPAEI